MRILNLRLECADLDRSLAFYEALGFVKAELTGGRSSNPEERSADDETSKLFGIAAGASLRVADLHATGRTPGTHLQLFQLPPPAGGTAQPQAAGSRLPAFTVSVRTKLEDALATIAQQGGEALSDPVSLSRFSNLRAVAVRDPDGHVIELIEPRAEILDLRRAANEFRGTAGVFHADVATSSSVALSAQRQAAAIENW